MQLTAAVPKQRGVGRVLDQRVPEHVFQFRRCLGFLPEGNFRIESYADGVNADRYGSDYRRIAGPASKVTKLKVALAEGGGFAARLVPIADAIKD